MDVSARSEGIWWGSSDLASGATGRWRIGPLTFWLARGEHEWRFACERGDDPLDDALECALDGVGDFPEEGEATRRLGFRKTGGRLKLTPMPADRSVVVTTATPFSLPPEEELTIYVSTILWLRIEVGEPATEFLQIPLHRPSDTWFGATTMEGELCYAVRTSARLQLENLPARPHRVLSAVRIRNRASDRLDVEKIKLPLPHMSLFATKEGRLWTETVTLERRQAGEHAALELGRKPPSHIGEPQRICGPRVLPEKGLLIRAFGGLIGGGR